MTETELKAQRQMAKANWMMKQTLLRAKQATEADVAEALTIYQRLRDYQAPKPASPSPARQNVQPANVQPVNVPVIPAMAVSEFTSLLEDLTIQRAEAHKQMSLRSNRLGDYPDETNVKDLVDEIEAWKLKRNAVGEKIAYLKLHGRLPDVEPVVSPEVASEATKSAFLVNLPNDRYELNKLLVNSLQPKLYRAKKALGKAKQEVWIAHYGKQVAQAQHEVDLVKTRISAFA